MEFFYVSFQRKIYTWIQQFCFGRKHKYLWKHFYTIKKPLKNRAILGFNDLSKRAEIYTSFKFN